MRSVSTRGYKKGRLLGTGTRSLPKHPSTAGSHLSLGCSTKDTHNSAKCCIVIYKKPQGTTPEATQVKPVTKPVVEVSLICLQRYDISQTCANFLNGICCKFRRYTDIIEQTCASCIEFMPENEVYCALLHTGIESVLSE